MKINKKLIALLSVFTSNLIISADLGANPEFLKNTEIAKVQTMQTALDTQYKLLFDAKLAALGKKSLGNDVSKTTAVKSFLEDLSSFTEPEKTAFYKYLTDQEFSLSSLKQAFGAGYDTKVPAGQRDNLELFRNFSPSDRATEIKNSSSRDNSNKESLLEDWQKAKQEVAKQEELVAKQENDLKLVALLPDALGELDRLKEKLLELDSSKFDKLIKAFDAFKTKWSAEGILDEIDLDSLNKELIEYCAITLKLDPGSEVARNNKFFLDNTNSIMIKVREYENMKTIFNQIVENIIKENIIITSDDLVKIFQKKILYEGLTNTEKEIFIKKVREEIQKKAPQLLSSKEVEAKLKAARLAAKEEVKKVSDQESIANKEAAKAEAAKVEAARLAATPEATEAAQKEAFTKELLETRQVVKEAETAARLKAAQKAVEQESAAQEAVEQTGVQRFKEAAAAAFKARTERLFETRAQTQARLAAERLE